MVTLWTATPGAGGGRLGQGEGGGGGEGGDGGGGGEGGGGDGGGGEGGGKHRGPQSLQSVPIEQELYCDPGPPSLQSPSDAAL